MIRFGQMRVSEAFRNPRVNLLMERRVIDPRLERIHSDGTGTFNEEELGEERDSRRFSGPKKSLVESRFNILTFECGEIHKIFTKHKDFHSFELY